jgi:hypothetical protein
MVPGTFIEAIFPAPKRGFGFLSCTRLDLSREAKNREKLVVCLNQITNLGFVHRHDEHIVAKTIRAKGLGFRSGLLPMSSQRSRQLTS